ncbi:MAG: aspartate--tRNA(Asn) ligase [Christensenellaceae bacterium]|jgi:aspartyl-tRNA synthetase|nr:aspartate--tRNA(Asn) ligase [Christensenellaceae bacterium]
MLKRTFIADLTPCEVVNLRGFVDTLRLQKSIQFIVIRDETGKVQVTVYRPELPEIAKIFDEITPESTVSITGKCVSAPNVKLGGIEIIPTKVEILSVAKLMPIDKDSGTELQLDYRWLDLRDRRKTAYFKLMTGINQIIREWFVNNGFIECLTPKLTAFSTEGGAEVFKVDYFDTKAFLTQSPQLFKQMAMAAGFGKFFEIGACYRAEKSFTSRHATEFFALDAELAFIDDENDIMDAEENMLLWTLQETEKRYGKIFADELGMEFTAQKNKFPRVTLLDAYKLLETEKGYLVPKASKGDLDPDGERLLCEIAKEKYGSDFIWITQFPAAARAFYTKRYDNNPDTAETKANGDTKRKDNTKLSHGFDLLFRGVEITSGAVREENPERLKENMRSKGINPDDMQFYTQFFEYGVPPHGGFAMGLARFYAKLFNTPSVKDTTFLFRGPTRLAP